MTRVDFIELFQEYLTGGDTSDETKRKYHPEVLVAFLDLALEKVNGDIVARQKGRGHNDPYGLDLLTVTEICIDTDCIKGQFGFKLPKAIQNLRDNAGIRMIGPSGKLTYYTQVETGALRMFGSMQAFKEDIYYSISRNRVTLYNAEPDQVDITYIPRLRALEDDDEVNYVDGAGADVFEAAKQLMGGHNPREDNVNQGVAEIK